MEHLLATGYTKSIYSDSTKNHSVQPDVNNFSHEFLIPTSRY